jgi:hypothetical protein
MLSAWNTRDESVLIQIVGETLTEDFIFCDPHFDFVGHAPFIDMVKAFWAKHGDCTISPASKIDAHHDRARYAWAITWPDGRRFDGFDAATLDLSSKKVKRVDGFFGKLELL